MKAKPAKSIDAYIASFPAEVQNRLQRIRATIKKAAPDAEEAIKYGIPTFVLNGNLVHFGAYKEHIGFYPAPAGIEEFRKQLEPYLGGRGTVKFPFTRPIPYALVTRIVKFRVKKNAPKKKRSKRP